MHAGRGARSIEEPTAQAVCGLARRVEKPGKNVKAKAGLNRAVFDATPGSLLNMPAGKAEEAGCELVIPSTSQGEAVVPLLSRGSQEGAVGMSAPMRMRVRRNPRSGGGAGHALGASGRQPSSPRASGPETSA